MRDYINYANDDLHARWNSKVEYAVDPRDGKLKWLLIALRSIYIQAMRSLGPMAGSTGLTIAWWKYNCLLGAATYVKAILMLLMLIHMTCLIGSSYAILTLTLLSMCILMTLMPLR